MSRLRVLFTVPETPDLMDVAVRSISAHAQPRAAGGLGPDLLALPPGLELDTAFSPVLLEGPESREGLLAYVAMRSANAPVLPSSARSYVVRGSIDAERLDSVTEQTTLPDGTTRVIADPDIGALPTGIGDPAVGTDLDVRRNLGTGRLRRLGMDGRGVGLAIVDNGVNLTNLRRYGLCPRMDRHASWSPLQAVPPGEFPVDHGSMCAYDALLCAPRATILDLAVLRSTRQGGSAMDGVLSDALMAYGRLLQMMLLPDDERPYHSLVVSNSWGIFHPSWDFPAGHPGRYSDNSQHPFNVIVRSLARAGADILFAAGNCGSRGPDGRCRGRTANTITGANSHPDVLCVAGVDTAGEVVKYSSRGPGSLTPEKPDLATFTHFLGSEAFGRAVADSGTSAACPVMAGVVAALHSVVPFVRGGARTPAAVRDFLRKHGTRKPSGIAGGADLRERRAGVRPLALGDELVADATVPGVEVDELFGDHDRVPRSEKTTRRRWDWPRSMRNSREIFWTMFQSGSRGPAVPHLPREPRKTLLPGRRRTRKPARICRGTSTWWRSSRYPRRSAREDRFQRVAWSRRVVQERRGIALGSIRETSPMPTA